MKLKRVLLSLCMPHNLFQRGSCFLGVAHESHLAVQCSHAPCAVFVGSRHSSCFLREVRSAELPSCAQSHLVVVWKRTVVLSRMGFFPWCSGLTTSNRLLLFHCTALYMFFIVLLCHSDAHREWVLNLKTSEAGYLGLWVWPQVRLHSQGTGSSLKTR